MNRRKDVSSVVIFSQSVFCIGIVGFSILTLTVLNDRSKWMTDLKEYNEGSTTDRVTHESVQSSLNEFAAKNGLIPVEVKKFEPKVSFPNPPKSFWEK